MRSFFLIAFFLLTATAVVAQKNTAQKKESGVPLEIVSADRLIFDQKKSEARRLLGNVQIRHGNTLMFCDSAWVYYPRNILFAFGHLHMKQGDSLNMYGDSLFYDGNTSYGKMRGHIRMVELDMTLETDSLEFDGREGIGWYSNGAVMRSARNKNTLTSIRGEYHSRSKDLLFSDSVVLTHPEYTMTCDTLRYHTLSETAFFRGPTLIRTDNGTIYCENGWFNTRTEHALFSKNAYLHSKEHILTGDSVTYHRSSETGTAHGNFVLTDTLNDFLLSGNYGWFNQKSGKTIVTDSACLIRFFEKDSLYLHADTLYSESHPDTKNRSVKAYRNVRFYKSDIQGKCDSLSYAESDSTLRLNGTPVLWHEENQLSARLIELKTKGKELERVDLYDNCFIISQADSGAYNQIRGRTMQGVFANDQLRKIDIRGNGQTIYYAGEEGKPHIGMNKADCSDIVIYLENKKITQITFINEPDAVFYPMDKINPKDRLLKDFKWHGLARPLSRQDIFRKE